jgi:ketosteroid isomerase-like protein
MKKTLWSVGAIVIALVVWFSLAHQVSAKSDDEAAIKALEQQFAAAVTAKDVDKIMAVYVPDESLFVFDLIPPRQYVGAKAYHDDWKGFIDGFNGPVKFDISDVTVLARGNLAFGHSIQHVSGTGKDGKPIDITTRVTDDYRKIKGNWLIVQEHVSVPVDLATGKADLSSKP